ncbi:MAG: hypothetical protein LBF27_34930 [Sphingobacterium sp.]|jgi:hypothetical protein|nr:hypothetical protein [Sphingobacterium sp.]
MERLEKKADECLNEHWFLWLEEGKLKAGGKSTVRCDSTALWRSYTCNVLIGIVSPPKSSLPLSKTSVGENAVRQ